MQFITPSDTSSNPSCVATIGFFDGVHKGHLFLIEQVCRLAKAQQSAAMLITFRRHPRQVMQTQYRPQLLSTLDEKCHLLSQTSADYCAILDFTKAMSELTARDFMEQVLKKQLNVKTLVIGYDHRFGHNRSEGFTDYVQYGQAMGMDVIKAEAMLIGEIAVSSSVIRTFLTGGEVEMAAKCLSRPYALEGTVVPGFQEGRKLGFPTANIAVNDPLKLIPGRGVYAARITLPEHSATYMGMVNIGIRPTMENQIEHETIETHVLDYQGDLYGQHLKIEFLKRLRDERKFRSKADLTKQLETDAAFVRTLNETNTNPS